MKYIFRVARQPNTWRLRKWTIVMLDENNMMVDQRFMFGGPRFEKRLDRKMKRMTKYQQMVVEVMSKWT